MFNKLFLVLSCVHYIYCASAPFIKKCPASDSKCMKESAQAAIPIFAAGVPELGVEKLEPFFMKSLDATSSNMKLILKDVTGTGLNKCIAKKIQYDMTNSKLSAKLLCTVDFEGQYDIDGNLLILHIEGHGHAHVVLRKVQISVEVDLQEVIGADSLKHWSIKKYTHSYELKDKATVELENLFNGNELLGRAAKELIASNPNEIVVEVGPPIVKAVVAKIVDNVDNLFKRVPLSDLIEK